jgi:hypothetical protein
MNQFTVRAIAIVEEKEGSYMASASEFGASVLDEASSTHSAKCQYEMKWKCRTSLVDEKKLFAARIIMSLYLFLKCASTGFLQECSKSLTECNSQDLEPQVVRDAI